MNHRHGDKTRWDKTPADFLERRGAGRSQGPNADECERYGARHDRHRDQSRHGKENGTDSNGEKHKRPSEYMRGWEGGDAHYDQGGHDYHREHKEYEGNSGHRKEHIEDEAERYKYHRRYRSKPEGGPRYSDSTTSSRFHQRDNDIVRVCPDGRLGYGSRGPRDRDHHGKDDEKRSSDEHPLVVERGRSRKRTPTLARDDSSSSSSGSSSHRVTKGSGSHSSDHTRNVASERSPPASSRRKHNRSRSGSRSSSGEQERKRQKKDKRKKDKSRKRDKDKEERRSVLTGKKIKLKVKKGRGDHERDANRQELLQFLNAAYD